MNETAPITVTVNADTAQAQKNLDSLHDSMAKVIGVAGPKPGWQTSEFWLKLLALLLTYLYASGTIPTTGVVAQAVAIGATMLGALGYTVVRGQLKKAHALGGLGLPLLDARNDNAAPAPAVKQAGFISLGLMVVIAAIASSVLLFGCGASTRLKTLNATTASVSAADMVFNAFEKQHEIDLANSPAVANRAEAQALVAAFIVNRDKARKAITAALNALSAAWKLDDDTSVANAVKAATAVTAALAALGVQL